jgi:ketosteroid isomerase-like protein
MSDHKHEIKARIATAFAAWNRRDWDAYLELLAPDFEIEVVDENATIRGREALTAYFERWLEAWDEFHREIEAIEVAPAEDRVFIAMRYAGKGKGSGVEVDGRFFIVASLRDGRIHRGSEYADRAPALASFKPTG